ncbi:hypothetical protein COO60DRAFT_1460283 [Scenedesmus sp. NREL 46B-D3]|nr:hypothetical protein COO60DRAFT_1460283 [Scenedesmus sp. NREL 46B-D3]
MDFLVVSEAARDALGYVGGGVLALSLVPQVIKLLLTRSAADISLLWSLMYLLGTAQQHPLCVPAAAGTVLSLVYLLLLGALAGAIPARHPGAEVGASTAAQQPGPESPRGAPNWHLWEHHQPERSGASLSNLGAEAWQALRRHGAVLLSLTGGGGSSSKASKAPTGSMQLQQQLAEPDMPAASAQCAGGLAAVGSLKRLQLAAGSSRRIKLQPALPVIQSNPATPRASEMAARGPFEAPGLLQLPWQRFRAESAINFCRILVDADCWPGTAA